ncbi:unnamed protein product [marine sediment metagenome]|uniref:Uncharacterized protein n=1 Tax=marine sediment metagenome TaxID=412755 RepID=X1N7S0_9ZZZZ
MAGIDKSGLDDGDQIGSKLSMSPDLLMIDEERERVDLNKNLT